MSTNDALARLTTVGRLFIVDSSKLGTPHRHQVAKWIAGTAISRGFETRIVGAETFAIDPCVKIDTGDVVLLILQQRWSEWGFVNVTPPWERWSRIAGSATERGALVILVAAGAQAASVAVCLGRGAHAVVEMDRAEDALDAAEEVVRGKRSSSELRSILPCPFAGEQLRRLAGLTNIELRILFYLTKGYPADRVASVEWMSLSTVRAHIRSIFRKLGVKSQLAAVALANGTAEPDEAADDRSPSAAS